MPGKTAKISHHFFFFFWLSIFYPDSCDARLLLFSHPSIFNRVWLIIPNTFSQPLTFLNLCSVANLCQAGHLESKAEKNPIFPTRYCRLCLEELLCLFMQYLCTSLPVIAFEVHLVFRLELTDFLSCVICFNSYDVAFSRRRQFSFTCVSVWIVFFKWG